MSKLTERSLSERLRRAAGASVVDNFYRGLAAVGRLDPRNDPEKQGVRVHRDIPYASTGRQAHLLDVFVPTDSLGPHPVVLYVHGGGFRILSKDTHFGMAMQFARRGYVVFNINYRLAPEHPFPAAIVDACSAYRWVVDNAESFGGDLQRLVLAGESAGANLVCGLTIAASYERDESWAQSVFETGVSPKVTAAACGMLQVTDIERFTEQERVHWFLADRLEEVYGAYLPEGTDDYDGELDFADPLVFLEQTPTPDRELPAFFLPVGTGDILLDDTRRLERALDALNTPHFACYYPGEIHAFHAFSWREHARKCWRQKFSFIAEHLA
jgi:acetyl esterase